MGAFEELIKDLEELKKLLEQNLGPFLYQPTTMGENSPGNSFDDHLAELMKLRQLGSVEQYQENFNSLFTGLELPMSYGINCFISGLKGEIQTVVRMFNPQTLHHAYCLAKLQEATLASIARKTTPSLGDKVGIQGQDQKIKLDEGLCEWCDEHYFPGHKCKKIGPSVVVTEEEETMRLDFGVENHPAVDAPQVVEESPEVNSGLCVQEEASEGGQMEDENSQVHVSECVALKSSFRNARHEMGGDEEPLVSGENLTAFVIGLKAVFGKQSAAVVAADSSAYSIKQLGTVEQHQGSLICLEEEVKGGRNPPNRLFDLFEDRKWEEANSFYSFAFDPGIFGAVIDTYRGLWMADRKHGFDANVYLINFIWKSLCSFVFYPGATMLSLSGVRLVFYPGVKIFVYPIVARGHYTERAVVAAIKTKRTIPFVNYVALVIDSTTGGFEVGISMDSRTCEHALLASTLGVEQMIRCCNKMEATTPKYSKAGYDELVKAPKLGFVASDSSNNSAKGTTAEVGWTMQAYLKYGEYDYSPFLALQPWMVFDPGGMRFLLTRLFLHTIHNLEAEGAVFDLGRLGVLRVTIAASSWAGAGGREVLKDCISASPVTVQAKKVHSHSTAQLHCSLVTSKLLGHGQRRQQGEEDAT